MFNPFFALFFNFLEAYL